MQELALFPQQVDNLGRLSGLIHITFISLCVTDGSKSHVARQSLNYIQEIGNGWFGKVRRSPCGVLQRG